MFIHVNFFCKQQQNEAKVFPAWADDDNLPRTSPIATRQSCNLPLPPIAPKIVTAHILIRGD